MRVARTLLRAGCDKEQSNHKGQSPLWVACAEGHVSVVQLLLKARADVGKVQDRAAGPSKAGMAQPRMAPALWTWRPSASAAACPCCWRAKGAISRLIRSAFGSSEDPNSAPRARRKWRKWLKLGPNGKLKGLLQPWPWSWRSWRSWRLRRPLSRPASGRHRWLRSAATSESSSVRPGRASKRRRPRTWWSCHRPSLVPWAPRYASARSWA